MRLLLVGGEAVGAGGEGGDAMLAEKYIMPSSAYRDAIRCDGRMKSGTQLHSSFSELFHTVKPTDSNEC